MAAHRPTCAATTVKGARCKNHAKPGSAYCGVHKDYGSAKPGKVPLGKLAGRAKTPSGSKGTEPAGGDMLARLNSAGSRDEATAMLGGMTVPQLRAFAGENSLVVTGRTKADIINNLVGQTVDAGKPGRGGAGPPGGGGAPPGRPPPRTAPGRSRRPSPRVPAQARPS
ncbi:hypothetical protein MXD60_26785, partial [Frankia sp. AgB32]